MELVVLRVFLLPAQEHWHAGGGVEKTALSSCHVSSCSVKDGESVRGYLAALRATLHPLNLFIGKRTSRLGVANAVDNKTLNSKR